MEIQIFVNDRFGEVRTMVINDEPWFVGKDVAMMLGYLNTQKAIRDHVDDEDRLGERIVLSGQNRMTIFINESGLLLSHPFLKASTGERVQALGDKRGASADKEDRRLHSGE